MPVWGAENLGGGLVPEVKLPYITVDLLAQMQPNLDHLLSIELPTKPADFASHTRDTCLSGIYIPRYCKFSF